MMITRSMRPQLGAKQTKLVAETLPSLLSTLTIKTVPRTHMHSTTNGETQKAESLAKPFSKHTRYVLTAYVDALNDPLCVMPPEIRRELEPGLFSLCEMLGTLEGIRETAVYRKRLDYCVLSP
ncbi:hypothetical protein ID866_5017 [Astraeus odoratus]|nr:hypothetical protein ID866_5017 [Astraeus odoratus]